MVVKKNAAVLRNLIRWARSLSLADNQDPIPDIPILVIDDEADYASVNTNMEYPNEDEDPTRINGMIRRSSAGLSEERIHWLHGYSVRQHFH